ncbi:MAG: exodeoxyribonuclease VII small subunit [Nitrospiraceae bacterium]|nr:MAG: exodeoxyribonuclease VII small subunit [Nitrospiraceae bacterium]
MSNDPGYREALEEIEAIVEEIESESVDIDVLTDRVKRATFLIKLCKAKLKKTDDEVKKVLKEFEAEEEG